MQSRYIFMKPETQAKDTKDTSHDFLADTSTKYRPPSLTGNDSGLWLHKKCF